MKYLPLVIVAAFALPNLSHSDIAQPREHKHEKPERQHTHHLPNSDTTHVHSARDSEQETSYERITSNNTRVFEREVGSYVKYDTEEEGSSLAQITFRSKNFETGESVLGIAETPVKSCENEAMGKVYIAYDGFEAGKWYSFEKDSSKSLPLAFEMHICKIIKSR